MAAKDNDKKPSADDNKIDHYVRLNLIASGKHAQVWEVQEENTNNRFAMKLLLPESMTDPELVATLKYEGKVAQALDHPNLIKWVATVHRKTNTYLILELFRSPNLKTFLINDTVGVHTRLRKLVECTCLALQHMHDKGWAHLDVKPDNILLSRSSEVKVIDFSLSQKFKSGIGRLLGGGKNIGGTLTYIAPETLRKESLTAQTDIYSFGITLYECLTGTIPFKGSTPRDLMMKHLSVQPAPPSDYNKNVTPEMDRLVLRMLAKKPKDRHKSMQEVYSEFRNIQPFKDDPEKLMEVKLKAAKESEMQQSLGKRLDSRTDASRSELIKQNPDMAKQFVAAASSQTKSKSAAALPAAPAAKSAPAKPAAAAPTMPPRPPMMPMPQPMGMPYSQQPPFMPMPQMPMPFAPMPGYFGAPPAAMPGYPPGAGAPMPGMPPLHPAAMMPHPAAQPPLPPTVSPHLVQPKAPVAPTPTSAPTPDAPTPPPASTAAPTTRTPARPAAGQVPPRVLQRPAPPPVPQGVDDLPTMEELPEVM